MVWLRLPREANRRLHLPSDPNQTNISRVIQTRQSLSKFNHATSYISRVSWIRPSVSRGIKTIPSQRLPRDQNHTISKSPEGSKPYHINVSRGIETIPSQRLPSNKTIPSWHLQSIKTIPSWHLPSIKTIPSLHISSIWSMPSIYIPFINHSIPHLQGFPKNCQKFQEIPGIPKPFCEFLEQLKKIFLRVQCKTYLPPNWDFF